MDPKTNTDTSAVMSVNQAAEKWGISPRRVSRLCQEGRIPGAFKPASRFWLIPADTKRPTDNRYKEGVSGGQPTEKREPKKKTETKKPKTKSKKQNKKRGPGRPRKDGQG